FEILLRRTRSRLIKIRCRTIDPAHLESAPREFDRMPPDTATQIEHRRAALEAEQRDHLIDFGYREPKPTRVEHVVLKSLPEGIVVVPVGHQILFYDVLFAATPFECAR